MTQHQPLLVANSIMKTFGRHGKSIVAVNDVSFALDKGSSLGIIGESGSGKSTLARIVIGLEKADSGEIRFAGQERELAHRPSSSKRRHNARQMQMVFQDPSVSLDPRETLTESLTRIIKLHYQLSSQETSVRIHTLVDAVGLTKRQADALPSALSGGQQQRVAIARALSVEPEILVLDEAVSALDVSVQAQILNLLNDLRAELQLSYLFVSHDLSVVRYVTDHSLVMRRGSVVEAGPTAAVLTDPQHPYTRLLLASVPKKGWDPDEALVLRRELELAEQSGTGEIR